jgi:hypothetical protein
MAAAEFPEQEPRPNRWLSATLRFGIAGLLMAYLIHSAAIDWDAFGGFVAYPELVAAALAMLSVSVVVTAMRLPILLRAMGFGLGTLPAIQLTLMGMFFGLFLPGSASGDAAKIYYAVSNQARGTRAELATVVLFDRAIGMWAMFAMPFAALPFFYPAVSGSEEIRTLLLFCGAVFVAGGVMLGAVLFAPAGWVDRARSLLSIELIWRVIDAVRGYRTHLRAIALAFLVSIGAHSAAIGTTAFVAGAVAPESQVAELALVVPLGFVANALPLTPGGIGVGEWAFHRLFEAIGLDGGAEVALGWRLGILCAALVGGLLYARGFRHRLLRLSGDEPSETETRE